MCNAVHIQFYVLKHETNFMTEEATPLTLTAVFRGQFDGDSLIKFGLPPIRNNNQEEDAQNTQSVLKIADKRK